MTITTPAVPLSDEDDVLAAEIALGLIAPADTAALLRRLSDDDALRARIGWWQERLAPLALPHAEAPDAAVWTGIDQRLPANDAAGTDAATTGAVRKWQAATGVFGSIAAALLLALVIRPDAVPVPAPAAPAASAPMVASLAGERGAAVAVSYDYASRQLVITPVSLDPGKGDAELWVIPAGQSAAISLGVIAADAPHARIIDARLARMIGMGSTLAISQEVKGGSPTGHAAGPIVASGKVVSS